MPRIFGPKGKPQLYLHIHGPFWSRDQDGSRVWCAFDDAEWTTFGFSLDSEFRALEFPAGVSIEGAHSLPPAGVVKEAETALLAKRQEKEQP